MRDFTKVSPSLWRSKKFRSLKSDEAKMIYVYLLTCPHGNSAGCFDIHPGYAAADLDMVSERYQEGLKLLCEAGLIECDTVENTVFITNWMEFNEPSNPKHALGILSQLGQTSSDALKAKRFNELQAVVRAKKFDREQSIRAAFDLFLNGIERVSPPRPDETETRDRDGDQTETRPDGDQDLREKAQTPSRPPATLTGGGLTASDPVDLYEKLSAIEASRPKGVSERLMKTALMQRSA